MRTSVRMRRKTQEREEARELRRQGLPLRQIARQLDVALSSASTWTRDVQRDIREADVGIASAPLEPPDQRGQRCGRCERTLPIDQFNKLRSGRQAWCRDCFRAYFKARGDLHRRQSGEAQRRRRQQARAFVTRHLQEHPCVDCGESDLVVLEFDHVGQKRGNVSKFRIEGLAIKKLKEEISQCEVVCVNCHRRRSALRANSWRTKRSLTSAFAGLTPAEERNMLYIAELLGRGCCADCGFDDVPALDFDHVRGKTGHVVYMGRRGWSLGRLKREVALCAIRCANCHRRRTTRLARRKQQTA